MSTIFTNEELAARIQQGETALYTQLWEQTKRLLFKLTASYYRLYRAQIMAAGATLEDVQQLSFFALRDAVDAFDADKGYRLSSYFRYALRNHIAELMGTRTRKRNPLNVCESIEEEVDGIEDLILADMLQDKAAELPFLCVEDCAYLDALHNTLERALASLPDDERRVLRLYYYDGMPHDDAAAVMGIPVETLSAMKRKGLNSLREYDRRNGRCLRVFLDIPIESEADILERAAYRNTGYRSYRTGGSSVERATEWTDRVWV